MGIFIDIYWENVGRGAKLADSPKKNIFPREQLLLSLVHACPVSEKIGGFLKMSFFV